MSNSSDLSTPLDFESALHGLASRLAGLALAVDGHIALHGAQDCRYLRGILQLAFDLIDQADALYEAYVQPATKVRPLLTGPRRERPDAGNVGPDFNARGDENNFGQKLTPFTSQLWPQKSSPPPFSGGER